MTATTNEKREGHTNWLIGDRQWQEILKHPVLRPEDFYLLNLIAIMSRYLLRPRQLREKKRYEKIRDAVESARKQEEPARDKLRDIISNDDLFAAIASEIDLLEIVFGIFEDTMVTPQAIRLQLQAELVHKERVLHLYDVIELKLGGVGRKGDDALSFIINFLNYLCHFRLRKFLSRSNEDICLVCQLYKVGAYGRDIDTRTVGDKIKDLNKTWDANEIEARIAKTQKIMSPPLSDLNILALFLATNKTRNVSRKVWERHREMKGIRRLIADLSEFAGSKSR